MSDRLSIDKKINESVIPQIDQTQILRLEKNNIDRIELFLFAMAIGIKIGRRTPLKAAHGFILETSIPNNAMSAIYSLLVQEMRNSNEEEKISDKDEAFSTAQEYANTGFGVISSWIDNLNVKDEDSILWELIAELDQKYDELFPEEGNK